MSRQLKLIGAIGYLTFVAFALIMIYRVLGSMFK
jgi:hypothetical protein